MMPDCDDSSTLRQQSLEDDNDMDESILSAADASTAAATPNPDADSSRAPSLFSTAPEFGATTAPRFTNDQKINQEYKLWKKNIPLMYDCFLMSASQFPTQTVDWINELEDVIEDHNGCSYRVQKIVTGSTARSETDADFNGIIVTNVRFPLAGSDGFSKMDDKNPDFRPNVGLFSGSPNAMTIHGIISQPCLLASVRVMPQKSNLVCGKLADNVLVIYDWEKECAEWSFDDDIEHRNPLIELTGHDRNLPASYGLAWNPSQLKEGLIASSGKDGRILVWDINGTKHDSSNEPYLSITGHEGEIEDVAWHPIHPTIIGSAGLNKTFCLFDIRSSNLSRPSHKVEAHTGSVNAISFALSEVLLATASDDSTVALWDIRNLERKLHTLQYHTGEVFTIDWCVDFERTRLLSSGGADRKICLWDVSKVGESQENLPLSITTPPELVFVHGGHSGRVTDVSWNATVGRKMMLASVAEDAITQVWMPARYQITPLPLRRNASSSVTSSATIDTTSSASTSSSGSPSQ